MGSPRNYSHITLADINAGKKYHVSQANLNQLTSLADTVTQTDAILTEIQNIKSDIDAQNALITSFYNIPIPANSVTPVDSFTISAGFYACDWKLSITDASTVNSKASTLKATWNYATGVGVNETVAVVGTVTDVSFSVAITATTITLNVVNTGTSTWSVRGRREFI